MQMPQMGKVIYPQLSFKICGLCFETYNALGRWLSEKSYADFLENIFKKNEIKFKRELALEETFEGERGRRNIVDFLIDDKIILDLKAKTIVTREDYYQMQRYLYCANKKLGLIINFRQKYLSPKRILNSRHSY